MNPVLLGEENRAVCKMTVDINDPFTLNAQWDTPDWLLIGSPVPEGHSGIDISPLIIAPPTNKSFSELVSDA